MAGTEVDRQIARTQDLLDRTSARYRTVSARGRQLRRRDAATRFKRTISAIALVLAGAVVAGFVHPIGGTGLLIAIGLLIASLAFLFIPTIPHVDGAGLAEAPLTALPLKTEIWLETQRKALPAPAVPLIDTIGNRLEMLAPQLAKLNPNEPAAQEIRKLLSDHLPQLVAGYQSIPADLRSVERNGRVPDAQLVEGLGVIAQEIGSMSEQLASGDLDKLAAHNRYLELKYQEAKELGE